MNTKRPNGPQAAKTKQIKVRLRHSRPLHKRVLLHPITVFMLLCASILIIGWTYLALAATYSVHGSVRASRLFSSAVISTPKNNESVPSSPTTIHGSCPADSYVKLYVNGVFGGAAWCMNSEFAIETSLSVGLNTLVTEDFNITDDQGPTSPPVTVTRPQPTPSSPASTSTQPTTAPLTQAASPSAIPAPPLLLSSDFHFQTFLTGHTYSWQIDLSGGSPPYTAVCNWGDGTSSTYIFKTDPLFTVSHTYKTAGYFPVVVHAVDSTGTKTVLQLAALIKTPGSSGFTATPNKTTPTKSQPAVSAPPSLSKTKRWLWVAWPAYIVVALMAFSFWLGERQEYHELAHRKRPRPHHQH